MQQICFQTYFLEIKNIFEQPEQLSITKTVA